MFRVLREFVVKNGVKNLASATRISGHRRWPFVLFFELQMI